MKQACIIIIFFSGLLLSCSNKKPAKLLSPRNLTSYFTTINTDSAYQLKTPNGASIKIPSNSFDVQPHTKIKIEIKEAYSMQDILLGGLSTESNGKPLRSAGMIYFNATANNQELQFLKPVQITIPSKTYDSSMQLFRSEMKADSTPNWINPQPVDTAPTVRNLMAGKLLFKANCAACHKPLKDFTGPALAGARDRAPDKEWPYKFINNVNFMLNSDPYARELKAKFGSQMTQFNLSKYAIKNILDYCDNEKGIAINNEAADEPIPVFDHPCGYDTIYIPKPKENTAITVISDSTNNSSFDSITPIPSAQSNTVIVDEEEKQFEKRGFVNVEATSGIYQFNIEKSGWYNIDVLFNEKTATKVQLFAKVQSPVKTDMTVYLCIPKRKILMEADKHNQDIYLFQYSDAEGWLQLCLNDIAYIFATATIGDKMYYGITQFKVQNKQTIVIDTKASTKEEILAAFKNNQLDSIKLDLDKKEMEIIEKPCGTPESPAPATVNTAPITK